MIIIVPVPPKGPIGIEFSIDNRIVIFSRNSSTSGLPSLRVPSDLIFRSDFKLTIEISLIEGKKKIGIYL